MSNFADRIGDRLARLVGAILRWRKAAIVTLLGAAFLCIWYAAHHLGVNTDTTNMMSPSLAWRQNFNEYREAFPSRDRNLLIVIDARTPARADAFAAQVLAELRRQPDLYHSILLQGEGDFFARNGLLYLPLPQLEQLADRLTAAQPLLGLLHARFDGAAVLDVASRTLSPPAGVQAGDASAAAPLYAELARVLDEAGTAAGRTPLEPLAWGNLISTGAAQQQGTRRLIVLQPALDFGKIQPAATAINGVRAIVARLNEAEAEPVTVRLTGSVAMEHDELASVSASAGIGGVAALLLVCGILYVALRSWRLLAISVTALFAGLAYTAAFAAATVGHLNLLSIMFVVLNVGLGADYVIHVLLRYRELVAEGYAAEPALLTTMRGVGSSLLLAAFTTAAGFYAFIPTQFQGVAELGWIAGTGIFFGFIAATTLLPALVVQFASSLRVRSARTVLDPRIFVPFNRHPRAVLGVATVVIVASAVALRWVSFDSNPIHLRDPKQRVGRDSARARGERRRAVAESRGGRARSRDRDSVGRGLARPARGTQRHHDRLPRAERPGREDRRARRSEARHGSGFRAARSRAGGSRASRGVACGTGERFGRPARSGPAACGRREIARRRSPRNRPPTRRNGWPRSIPR